MTLVWLDGVVSDAGSATVSALDHGLTVGDGVFETCKVIDGHVFALTRHLRRLARSAAVLELACPPADVVRAAAEQLLAAAPAHPLGRLRITVTGGPGPLGTERGPTGPTLILALAPAAPWPDRIEAVTVPWPRNEHSPLTGAKTTSYAENVVALAAARRRGAHEALLANLAGQLCEGTGSNVLLVVGGRLVTPPLSSGCLAGITRELLLEWAHEHALPIAEEAIDLADLAAADDVLLLSSTRDVQRVAAVDGRTVPGHHLGDQARELFAAQAAGRLDP